MTNEEKKKIYETFLENGNKTQTAKMFAISPRTVGRIVESFAGVEDPMEDDELPADEFDDDLELDVDYDVERLTEGSVSEPVKEYRYFAILDGSLINVTRIAVDGSEPPHSEIAYSNSPNYEKAVSAYRAGDHEGAFLAISYKHRIEKMCVGRVTVFPEQNKLTYNDGTSSFDFTSSLTKRIVDKLSANESVDGLMKFANLLADNPSPRAVSELYDFLVASDIEITDEGMVRCFKKVRENYTDVYTGTFDNSVGNVVSMPRHMVNDDSKQTCSRGLHVCSRAYLNHFGGERVVSVDVNPADFVSIPEDYYSIDGNGTVKAKARVSRYVVVADITQEV